MGEVVEFHHYKPSSNKPSPDFVLPDTKPTLQDRFLGAGALVASLLPQSIGLVGGGLRTFAFTLATSLLGILFGVILFKTRESDDIGLHLLPKGDQQDTDRSDRKMAA